MSIRSETEIRAELATLQNILHELRFNRSQPGRSDALKSSDSISMSLAAAQINALSFVLGEIPSTMIRSNRLKV